MSSQESNLIQTNETTITTQEKIKDQKKVEQGKKLADISRKAKEAKKKRLEELEKQASENNWSYKPAIVIISLLGIGVFCFMNYKPTIKKQEPHSPEKPKLDSPEPKKPKLDTFD